MTQTPHLYVVLLRAIGPVTHRLMSMTDWRDASAEAGFVEPETLVNTGNMIAGFPGTAAEATRTMTAVLRGFGLGDNVVPILRTPGLIKKLIKADPIAGAKPAETAVFFFDRKAPDFSWLADYVGPEKTHVVQDHLVVDFSQDVAKSARLIRQIDKNCGLNTSRNWNSVRRIADSCAARGKTA